MVTVPGSAPIVEEVLAVGGECKINPTPAKKHVSAPALLDVRRRQTADPAYWRCLLCQARGWAGSGEEAGMVKLDVFGQSFCLSPMRAELRVVLGEIRSESNIR